jgi:hypothetical protein
MMHRLVVNPGTPQAWEIQLKPGTTFLGRAAHNDFALEDLSVSGSHCQIVVHDDSVEIKDLGSTNGTFVEHAPIQEAKLTPGQTIRLGGVEMLFYGDDNKPATPAAVRPAPIRVARVSAPPVPPPVIPPPASVVESGRQLCKFHPKSPARYLCNKCNRTFCELCVTSRTVGGVVRKTCRTCGVECVPLQVRLERPAPPKGFFARLPGVLIYPFHGSGFLILLVATLLFAVLRIMSFGWFSILMTMVALGYLFSYMQNIIHATAAGHNEMPSLPEMDELFGAFFRLTGTVLMAFGVPLGLFVARLFEVDVPVSAIMVTGILGSFYFPMAFLAVAMKDTALSANPLIVIPAILKVPLQYIVTAILFASIFGISQLGNTVVGLVKVVSFTTTSWSLFFASFALRACWSFISVYLLTINMRILGLLYLTNKEKLGWFSH